MNEIRKVGTIVDEKRRYVIANQIMITTLAVYLGSKAMSVSANFAPSVAGNHNRESSEDLASRRSFTKPACRSDVTPITVRFKDSVSAMTEGMDYSLGLSLMVEVNHLLASRRVFKQNIASGSST